VSAASPAQRPPERTGMNDPVDTSKPAEPPGPGAGAPAPVAPPAAALPPPATGAPSAGARRNVSLGDQVMELKDLVIAYFRQETLDPITSLGRFILWGLLGAVMIGIGVVFLALAALRALETETDGHLDGNWSWVPYLVVFVALVIGGLVSWKIGRRRRR
jgi:membrane protein YqaA with SNARE-associated domain